MNTQDISPEIIKLKKLLNQLEVLNSNPHLVGKKLVTDAVAEIKTTVIHLEILVANYAD
jgi:hypothetical protein